VSYLTDAALASYSQAYAQRGAPPMLVVGSRRSYRLGDGEPTITLSGDDYELLRIVFGRRSRDQILAGGWSGDPSAYVDTIHLFPCPSHALAE
jgi:hypothetical protein